MNVGFILVDYWVQDMEVGGGCIIGEVCYFIDFIFFFVGSQVEVVVMNVFGLDLKENIDNVVILFWY